MEKLIPIILEYGGNTGIGLLVLINLGMTWGLRRSVYNGISKSLQDTREAVARIEGRLKGE